ncbi:hypothetical protein HDV63DRAFT_242354 [Trichoderma sp. SZMC 28014]
MRFSTWRLLFVSPPAHSPSSHTHTHTHAPPPPTSLLWWILKKKKSQGRGKKRLEGKPRLSQTNQQPRPRLQAARVCPPMMAATIAQIGLASTPGLPKQANRGTLNSHEASNVPQQRRGCLPCLCHVLLPSQVRWDQPGCGRGCLLTDVFLRVCVDWRYTDTTPSTLSVVLNNFYLLFLVFFSSFTCPFIWQGWPLDLDYIQSATKRILCYVCCAALSWARRKMRWKWLYE